MTKLAEYAKFIAALIGAFLTSFAGLLPDEVAPWATAVSGFLTALAVVLVPNARPEPLEVAVVPAENEGI